jgi:hypothetical protein
VTAAEQQPTPRDETLDFITALYEPAPDGLWVSLFSVNRNPTSPQDARNVDWAPVDSYDDVTEHIDRRRPDCCVWIGYAPRTHQLPGGRRGGDQDTAGLTALPLDIDIEGPNHKGTKKLPRTIDQAWEIIQRFPVLPSCVINTGGGLQAWWMLKEWCPADDAAGLLETWAGNWEAIARDSGYHIDNVFDPARVMRVPGTYNTKTGRRTPVRTLTADWARRYDTSELADACLAAPEPPPAAERPATPYIGPERPGDAFNAARTGSDILSRAGWVLHHRDRNGDEHWTRPGKERREGASATVYAEDGHTTVWSDAIPGIETRRPYDPFGLLTVLHYRADFTAASDALEAQGYGTKARGDDDLTWIPDPDETDTPAVELVAEQDPAYFVDPDLDEFLNTDDPDYDWLVEGLLERQDRIIITGPEGGGKSTLLRQIAIQLASGVHPFTDAPVEPLQVLLIDCENSARQVRRKLRDLRDPAGDSYVAGRLRLRILGHAIDLADKAIQDDIAIRIETQQVDVVVIGPLYKLIDDDPIKELPAKAVADAIDRLRQIRGSAVLIEAHSPYAEGNGKKRPIRPYGASLWSRWPEFGFHLGEEGAITHWRGQREERAWPKLLTRSLPWPWAAVDLPADDEESQEWNGPTECASAIVALLDELSEELTTRKITDELRARGLSYRDDTIRAAARMAKNDGRLSHRAGPRKSDLYRSANGSEGEQSAF